MKTTFRTQKCLTASEMIGLYKSKLLTNIEYRTPEILHACDTDLEMSAGAGTLLATNAAGEQSSLHPWLVEGGFS